ncbi:MAG TPA: WxL domain-containing protein [Solirubrobacteraceae bacterium]
MKLRTMLPVAAAAVSSMLLMAAPAFATSASATLTAGSLAFATTPGAVNFPSTNLNGQDKAVTTPQPLDIADATGSGAGWNVTATSTVFKSGSNSLPAGATTVTSAPAAPTCDSNSTCTPATSTGVSYPYSLPAGATTAPTATKLFNAPLGSGMGDQTVTPTWTLAIPANAYAGSYTSTWTLSLVSGP